MSTAKAECLKSFNYVIGMFGTSIPINMLKTYAAIYYVDRLGMTTPQMEETTGKVEPVSDETLVEDRGFCD